MNWSPTPVDSNAEPQIRIIVATPPNNALSSEFQMDKRFYLVGKPYDPNTLLDNVNTLEPEAVVIDALIFQGIAMLLDFVSKLQCPFYVIYPTQIKILEEQDPEVRNFRNKIAALNYHGFSYDNGYPANTEITGRVASGVYTERTKKAAPSSSWGGAGASVGSVSGLRVICVWNRAGGTGKSTVSVALGREAARRGFKTLVVGLGAPDSIPVIAGVKVTPNIGEWLARPNREGLMSAIKTTDGLDILPGLTEAEREDSLKAMPTGKDTDTSITRMQQIASLMGYTVIILDTPVSGCAPQAIAASNFLLLVSRPTIADALASVDAFHLVSAKMGSQHNISAGNIYLVLNGMRSSLLNTRDFQDTAFEMWKLRTAQVQGKQQMASFPAVSAVLPDSEAIPAAANNSRSPLSVNDEYAKSISKLGDVLFGGIRQVSNSGKESSVVNIFGIKIRKTG